MSGIAGIIHFDGKPIEPGLIEKMTGAMSHRGPDGCATHMFPGAGFSYAQVALDSDDLPSGGIECSPGDGLAVVADARLYNRREVASELDLPKDASPANVILNAYKVWGPGLLDRIDGDFAFAIYSVREGRLFAGRDIFGAKPLFYAVLPNLLIFGSEPKQLFSAGTNLPVEPEPIEVARYLMDQPSSGENTVWKRIRRLRAGHCLTATAHEAKQTAYWRPSLCIDESIRSWQDCVVEARGLLVQAVEARLDVSVPVAIELSGGYDSSSIALLAAGHQCSRALRGGATLTAISATYPGFDTDETPFIQSVAEELRYPALRFEAPLDPTNTSLADECRKIDSPAVPVECVRDNQEAEMVRSLGARVLVTGLGGDDVFWEPNPGPDLLRNRELSLFWRWYLAARPSIRESFGAALHTALREHVPEAFRALYRRAQRRFRRNREYGHLASGLRILIDRDLGLEGYPVPVSDQLASKEIFGWLTSSRLSCSIELMEATRSHQGLEMRHPFLDRKLAEFILRVPVTLRVPYHARIKPILQEAMVGILPNDVLARNTKATFDPYYIRLLEAWCKRFPDVFATGGSQFDGYLRIRKDVAVADCNLSGRYELWSEVRPLWAAITLLTWLSDIGSYSRVPNHA